VTSAAHREGPRNSDCKPPVIVSQTKLGILNEKTPSLRECTDYRCVCGIAYQWNDLLHENQASGAALAAFQREKPVQSGVRTPNTSEHC